MTTTDEAREAAARIGHLEARLTGRQAIVDFLRALLLLGLAAASLVFLAVSRHWYWLFSLLVLGSTGLLWGWNALYQYFARRPVLLLDDEGLHHVLLGTIGWRDVVGVSLRAVPNGTSCFAFGVAPGARMEGRVPWSLARGSHRLVPLTGLTRTPAEVLAMAEFLRDRVSPPRLASWYYGISKEREASFRQNERLLAAFEQLAAKPVQQAGTDAELHRLTAQLDANTAQMRSARESATRKLALSGRLLFVGLALALTLPLIAGIVWALLR